MKTVNGGIDIDQLIEQASDKLRLQLIASLAGEILKREPFEIKVEELLRMYRCAAKEDDGR